MVPATIGVKDRRKVEKSCAAYLVVAHFSIGTSNFHKRQHVSGRHKRLFGKDPAQRKRREEAKPFAFREILRPIITHIELRKVFLPIVISHPIDKTLVPSGHIVFLARCRISFLHVKPHGRDIMVTQIFYIVQGPFKINLSVSAVAFAKTKGSIHSLRKKYRLCIVLGIPYDAVSYAFLRSPYRMLVIVIVSHHTSCTQSLSNKIQLVVQTHVGGHRTVEIPLETVVDDGIQGAA